MARVPHSINAHFSDTVTIDLPSIADNATKIHTETGVTGVKNGFYYLIYPVAVTSELSIASLGKGSADGSLDIRITNSSGGAIDPGSATFDIIGI